MIPLYEIFREDKSIYTESRSIVVQGWMERLVVNAPKETFQDDATLLKLNCGDSYTSLCKNHKIILYLQWVNFMAHK